MKKMLLLIVWTLLPISVQAGDVCRLVWHSKHKLPDSISYYVVSKITDFTDVITDTTISWKSWSGFVIPTPDFWKSWSGFVIPTPDFWKSWNGFVMPTPDTMTHYIVRIDTTWEDLVDSCDTSWVHTIDSCLISGDSLHHISYTKTYKITTYLRSHIDTIWAQKDIHGQEIDTSGFYFSSDITLHVLDSHIVIPDATTHYIVRIDTVSQETKTISDTTKTVIEGIGVRYDIVSIVYNKSEPKYDTIRAPLVDVKLDSMEWRALQRIIKRELRPRHTDSVHTRWGE